MDGELWHFVASKFAPWLADDRIAMFIVIVELLLVIIRILLRVDL